MQRFVLRYGLISVCISCALALINWFLIARPLGYDASQVFGYAAIIISLMVIPLAIEYFRGKLNQGVVSFGQALGIGSGISGIASLGMFCYSFLFFAIGGDSFKKWYEESLSEAELNDYLNQLAEMPSYAQEAWFQALVMLATVLIIGMLITLISALIFPRLSSRS